MVTHFLRTGKNDTVVEVDASKNDLSSTVVISEFGRLLLDAELSKQEEMIEDFDALQELRGEFHETPHQQETPDGLARRRLREIGDKYGIFYVTD